VDSQIWKIHVITPAKNEAHNLSALSKTLGGRNAKYIKMWTVVDDNSSDNTEKLLTELKCSIPFEYVKFASPGKLISGGAYKTWMHGALHDGFPKDRTHVMKLDADVRLADDYFDLLFNSPFNTFDMLGGTIETGSGKEQRTVIPGPVKLYSMAAFRLVSELPLETGFDVVDEPVCKDSGLRAVVIPEAKFSLSRPIGFSEGKLHGRFRNGRVCRWTGYSKLYFSLHLLRYIFRKPYFVGSIWMFVGYLTAPRSPYNLEIRALIRSEQRLKMRNLLADPIRWLKETY